MTSNTEVEIGFCQCGCGEKTSLAAQNNPARGIVKGQPMRYVAGHFQRAKGQYSESGEGEEKDLEGRGPDTEDIGMGEEDESGPEDENASPPPLARLKAKAVVVDDRRHQRELPAYSELLFSAKGTPTDPNDVTLIVNGEPLTIKRGDKVITPRRFRECADHATYPVYHQMPDHQRMVTARVMVFPYSCLREDVPEAEYLAQKAAGDKISREIYERTMEMV